CSVTMSCFCVKLPVRLIEPPKSKVLEADISKIVFACSKSFTVPPNGVKVVLVPDADMENESHDLETSPLNVCDTSGMVRSVEGELVVCVNEPPSETVSKDLL